MKTIIKWKVNLNNTNIKNIIEKVIEDNVFYDRIDVCASGAGIAFIKCYKNKILLDCFYIDEKNIMRQASQCSICKNYFIQGATEKSICRDCKANRLQYNIKKGGYNEFKK
ncbi:MAG: hypothetical protein ACPLZ9_03975 [Candidatus Ratteibacteria bacterium]